VRVRGPKTVFSDPGFRLTSVEIEANGSKAHLKYKKPCSRFGPRRKASGHLKGQKWELAESQSSIFGPEKTPNALELFLREIAA
jgi:hypothetical protein